MVLDAMFGFGFKGDPRPPFDTILQDLSGAETAVVSVDVPSGWSVRTSSPSVGWRGDRGAAALPCGRVDPIPSQSFALIRHAPTASDIHLRLALSGSS